MKPTSTNRMLATAALFMAALLGLSAANAFTINTLTLPEGNVILQVEDAVAGSTGGGTATAARRTIYFRSTDFNDPQPNFPDYTGGNWPYVYLPLGAVVGDIIIADPTITAVLDLLPISPSGLQGLLVNGNPVYQYVNDTSASDAKGNIGPWFYVKPDGTATQQRVPLPATVFLMAVGLMGLAANRRRLTRQGRPAHAHNE